MTMRRARSDRDAECKGGEVVLDHDLACTANFVASHRRAVRHP
jgi:hypothetical protein